MNQTRIAELRQPNPAMTRAEAQAIITECLDEIVKLQRRREKNIGPSLRECIEYGEVIGVSMDEATKFFDYHTARGWKMGKTAAAPMRDWKAALRLWKRNCAPANGNEKPQSIGARFGVG